MIPMKQSVTIQKDRGLDNWGQTLEAEFLTFFCCRQDLGSKLVTNKEGKEVVVNTAFILKGLVLVQYSDLIQWEDEIGHAFSKTPVQISIIRDLSGNPLFTKVVV